MAMPVAERRQTLLIFTDAELEDELEIRDEESRFSIMGQNSEVGKIATLANRLSDEEQDIIVV